MYTYPNFTSCSELDYSASVERWDNPILWPLDPHVSPMQGWLDVAKTVTTPYTYLVHNDGYASAFAFWRREELARRGLVYVYPSFLFFYFFYHLIFASSLPRSSLTFALSDGPATANLPLSNRYALDDYFLCELVEALKARKAEHTGDGPHFAIAAPMLYVPSEGIPRTPVDSPSP